MSAVDWSWGQRYDTPTLAVFPGPTHQQPPSILNSDSHQPQPSQPLTFSEPPWPIRPHLITRPSLLLASRKRSRDELSDWDDADSSRASPARRTPSPPKQKPILGPGMSLIYPNDPAYRPLAEGSQTGTWAEDLVEQMRDSHFEERPALERMESRKAMRLDREDVGLDDEARAAMPEDVRSGAVLIERPTIDEATRALGIGWYSIPSNPTMDAASRGWARYIEDHFPLRSVRIVWQNTTMPAYLVSAITRGPWGGQGSPGYYLFDEALNQGRMLAKSWETALDCLRCTPVAFEGEEVMVKDGHRGREVEMVVGGAGGWEGWRRSEGVDADVSMGDGGEMEM